MLDIMKVKNIFTGAVFLPARQLLESSPVKTLIDLFPFNVSISVYTEKSASNNSYCLNDISFFEELQHFGMSRFTNKYFTYIVLDNRYEIIHFNNSLYPSLSYNFTIIVFLNSEEDKKILVSDWCLLKKLTD